MKGGKGGQGRKRSNVRLVGVGKSKAQIGGKKNAANRNRVAQPRKEIKTTTRLGANRVPDDA